MIDREIERRLAAIENNVNANTSLLMAIVAAFEALPEATRIDATKAAGLLRAKAATQPALAARVDDAAGCLTAILRTIQMNAGK